MKHYLALILLVLLVTCKSENTTASYQENYHLPIKIGEHNFLAEVADTPQAKKKGLMYRPCIKDNQVILFIYDEPRILSFWMKNMKISLDMLFFDSSGVLQEIKRNIPPCTTTKCPSYVTSSDSKMVVEMKAGLAETLEIHIGDKIYLSKLK